MPLLESMLLSLLLTPVEIGPSNASPGKQRKKERNGTNKKYDTRQKKTICAYIYISLRYERKYIRQSKIP